MRVRLARVPVPFESRLGHKLNCADRQRPGLPRFSTICLHSSLSPDTGWEVMMRAVCLARLGETAVRVTWPMYPTIPRAIGCSVFHLYPPRPVTNRASRAGLDRYRSGCLRLFGPNLTSRLCSAFGNCESAIQRPSIPAPHFPSCVCTC